jgi:hypothetical protein
MEVELKREEFNVRKMLAEVQAYEAMVRTKQIQAELEMIERNKDIIFKLQERLFKRMNDLLTEKNTDMNQLK